MDNEEKPEWVGIAFALNRETGRVYKIPSEGCPFVRVDFVVPNLEKKTATDTEILDWLGNQYGLHREVEIIYVVDGYEVEFTYNGNPTDGKHYHGETLRDALRKAMNAVPNK